MRGAVNDPPLPNVAKIPSARLRIGVGNTSLEYMQTNI